MSHHRRAKLMALLLAAGALPAAGQMATASNGKFLGNILKSTTTVDPAFDTYWNQATPENSGKWGKVEATRDVMNWTQLDFAHNHTRNRGIPFKLHTLGAGNGSGTFTGNMTASGTRVVSLVKNGTGTQAFSGSVTYRGTTTINGGTLEFDKASSLYAGVTTDWTKTKVIVNNGSTISFHVGGTNEFTAGNVTTLLTGLGGAVTNNGLRAGSTLAFDTTNASDGAFTIANVIANTTGTGGGAIGLKKLGANSLILSNANSYTGPTNVDSGTLVVTGSLGASAVNVTGGSLAGNGNFGGNVTIAPGAMISFAVASNATSQDTSAVTGILAIAQSTIDLTAASPPSAGVYVLATATVGITGSPDFINKNGIQGNVSMDSASTPKRLLLTVSSNPHDTWAAINAPGSNPDEDFDGDGVPNAIEFVLGGTKDTNDLGKLPAVATIGTNMTFTFVRDRDSVGPGMSVAIEVGSNLASWPDVFTVGANTAGSSAGVTVTDSGNGTDTITLALPQVPETSKYARLKVDITP